MRAVRLRRAHRDVELLGDLLVRVAQSEQPQAPLAHDLRADPPRPAGAPRRRRRPCARRGSDGRSCHPRRPPGRPTTSASAASLRRSHGPRRESLAHVARVVLHREHQDLRLRGSSAGAREHLDPASGRASRRPAGRRPVSRSSPRRCALGASPASPTVSMSSSASSSRRSPARTTAWSSTISDADAHGRGTSTTSVVPEPGVDSTVSRPPCERDALPHPDEARCVRRASARVEALPSSSTTQRPSSFFRCSRMLTRPASACLTMFVSASWIDRDRTSSPPRSGVAPRRAATPDRPAGRVCSRNVSARRSTRGHEPEVVECGRTQLDCEAPHVLQRRDDELAKCARRASRTSAGSRRLLERLQAEQNRRQRLPCLVVQLARQAPPLQLLRFDDPADGVAADPP